MKHWHLESHPPYCHLVLDQAGRSQNLLSAEVLTELDAALTELESMQCQGVLLCSAKPTTFIAGADVSEFDQLSTAEHARTMVTRAHQVIDRLENLPIPTIAVLNGHCLGGGLELALACRYRIVSDTPNIRLGLPEVLLGIHPGFGGSVRLIETIGALTALPLMLAGRTLTPTAAQKLGLVDRAVPPRQLLPAARYLLAQGAPRRRAPTWQRALNHPPARHLVSLLLKRQVAAKVNASHYPAAFKLLNLWQRHGDTRDAMLKAEIESVAELLTTPTARNLVKVFFRREQLKKLGKPQATPAMGSSKPPAFERVHVVGAGVMGGDIAAWCALRGLTVTLEDQNPAALARATQRAYQLFKRKLKHPRLVQNAADRLHIDVAGHGATKADLIIEAIIEDAAAKIEVFSRLQNVAKPDAILATNTSSIPLDILCNALPQPGRVVGVHFFNPVARMQLIEIVGGDKTHPKVRTAALAFATQIQRLPVPVKSCAGFLVNRVLTPYLLEAVELHQQGIPLAQIDKAATDFGMPMGPLTLADTVGLDICLRVAENLNATGGELPPVLQAKLNAGHLGQKTGQGFYRWHNGKPQPPRRGRAAAARLDDIQPRLIFRYLNECVACLDAGIVDNARHLDAGLIFATGFAPFRGGPINHIVTQGQQATLEQLQYLHDKYGAHFAPSDGWTRLDLARLLAD